MAQYSADWETHRGWGLTRKVTTNREVVDDVAEITDEMLSLLPHSILTRNSASNLLTHTQTVSVFRGSAPLTTQSNACIETIYEFKLILNV